MCGGQTGLPAGIPGAGAHGTADRPGRPGPLRRCAWALASPGKATLRPRGAAPLGGPEGAASDQAGQCVGDTGRERQWEVALSERSVGNRRPAVRARQVVTKVCWARELVSARPLALGRPRSSDRCPPGLTRAHSRGAAPGTSPAPTLRAEVTPSASPGRLRGAAQRAR